MGNDKTSWLDLNEDDDLNDDFGKDAPYTESLPNRGPGGQEPTHVPHQPGGNEGRTVVDPGVEKTEVYHAGKKDQYSGTGKFDPMTDPVTAWLVVVKGPGLGQSVALGSGMNTIGRESSASVSLPFGDTLISREDHLRIIYDDANRAFFLAPGGGRGISRVDGALVAQTMPLENYALVELSKQTHVRFVAFCNESFDWSDLPVDES